MGESRGPDKESGSLIAVIGCLLMLALYPVLHAYDRSIPDHVGRTGGGTRLEEILPWWKCEGEITWVCPRCGAQDNVSFIARCMRCGYAMGNPEEYLLAPVGAACITNGYSSGHRAVDFGVPEGTPVLAAGDGVVTEVVENDRSRGNALKISHEDDIDTLYGHLGEILAPPGGYVRMGEIVALSGSTGASTGPHLHFELHHNGGPEDPLSFLGSRQ